MEDKIKEIICEIKKNSINPSEINNDLNLLTEIGLTSLDLVSLMFKVEDELGIELNMDDFNYESLTSFYKFVDFVKSQQQQ